MSQHRFAVGGRVHVSPSKGNVQILEGIYTIVRVMPKSNGQFQYRAKSITEGYERVFDEGQLEPADAPNRPNHPRGKPLS
jgi:hypothetical protein